MTTIITVGMALSFAALLLCLRVLVCNARTGSERHKIIDRVFRGDGSDYHGRLMAYEAVSYSRHLLDRVFFRDPFHRYPKDLWPLAELASRREP